MKKSFVKLLLSGAMVLAGFAFVGCNDLDTEIAGINDRLTALEAEVDALQAAIDGGAVITSVTPTTNGVKVTLSNGKDFELTNGANGANGTNGTNGTNGKDGSVVTIGENGNWFIDGKDTGLAAEGKAGAQGPAGKDGVYYYPHEDGFFHKVDGDQDTATEITWLPEGTVTAVWADGSLLLYNVEGVEEGEALEIVLSSSLKSLALVPETLLDSRGVIDFYTIAIPDPEADPMDLYAEPVFVTSAPAYATYVVNPKNADLTNLTWEFVSYGVTVRSDEVASDLVSYVGEPMATNNGMVSFALVANDELPAYSTEAEGEQVLVGLQATDNTTGEVITSDFAYAQAKTLQYYSIINKDWWNSDLDEDGEADKTLVGYAIQNVDYTEALESGDITADIFPVELEMTYGEDFDFDDYLETYTSELRDILPSIDVNPTYKITMPKKALGYDGETNQQKFVTLDPATNVVTVNENVYGTSALNRTPIFKVESQVENAEGEKVTLVYAFIAVKIVEKAVTPEPLQPLEITVEGEFEYSELVASGDYTEALEGFIYPDWETVNKEIYKVLGMSHEQFVNTYTITPNDITVDPAEDAAAIDCYYVQMADAGWDAIANTSTALAAVHITNAIDEDATGVVKYTFKADGKRDVVIKFNYSVTHEHEWPAFNPDYIAGTEHGMTVIEVKGKLVNNAWALHSTIKEHFEEYLTDYEPNINHADVKYTLPYLSAPYTPIAVDATDEEKALGTAQTAAEFVSGNTVTVATDDIKLATPLTENFKDIVVTMYETLANNNICEKSYVVRFTNPFTIVVGDIELDTFLAEHDTEDIKKYVKIYDHATDRTDAHLIWDGSKTPEAQEAADPYKLGTITLGDYDLVFDATTDTEASFGDNLNLVETSKVDWYNDGAVLKNDKKAKYAVTVTIPGICETEAVGNIKVNKSK